MKLRTLRLLAFSLLLALPAGSPGAEMAMTNTYGDGTTISSGKLQLGNGAIAGSGTAATLHLSNGDYLAGELRGCGQTGILRWQGPAFLAPLDFPLGVVSAVSFPAPGSRPPPAGGYCLELDGGDVLYGDLAGLSGDDCRFDAAGLGLLHVQRPAIQRIFHCRQGADLVYLGPNGLLEWEQSPNGAWRQDAGGISTDQAGASLVGDLGLPNQACVDFALSWTPNPDFSLVFGTRAKSPSEPLVAPVRARRVLRAGGDSPPDNGLFRVEVVAGKLVLLTETWQKGDLVSLQDIAPGTGRCHFRIYLDQEHNRAIAFAADGKPLADLSVAEVPPPKPGGKAPKPNGALLAIAEALNVEASRAQGVTAPKDPGPGTCVRLVNHRGNVRLELLSITRWDGAPPRSAQGDKSRLVHPDGSVLNGHIEGFDGPTREFLVSGEDGRTSRVPADAVDSIVLPASARLTSFEVRAMCASGARLSGNLRKVEDGRLWLDRPGIKQPLAIKLSSLHSLVVLENRGPQKEPSGRRGRLEGDGLRLDGCLVETGQAPAASCLAWRPRGSATSSPLKPDFSGRIVYREPPAPRQSAPEEQNLRMRGFAAPMVGPVFVMGGIVGNDYRPRPPRAPWNGPAMYLRTGDTIACEVTRIDQRGVTFRSPRLDATFVPQDKVKAVELASSRTTKIDLSKRDRLLTLPRMEKEDPPTHLIRSTDGDYLRGRLVELDDKTLTVEVREETRRVPRDRVATIIWLEESGKKDKAGPPKKPETGGKQATPEKQATVAKPLPGTRVQSLRSDGVRLTFRAEKLTGTILRGTSDVLGFCRVELSEVDQLIIGREIEQAAQALPYQRWNLQPAIEPKFAQEDQGGGAGMESELVGKPAPDFELETLDGPRFRLRDQRKKIVVVDFWATWCGPCRQTLPELVRAAAKYQDHNVVLLTVNLQETPKAIKAMLATLELKMAVALDRDGAVAEKYAAVAIPQTVIIDADGKVARLFVGGGPQYFDQVSAALEALVNPGTGQAKPQ
jgi:peroxiredoxin